MFLILKIKYYKYKYYFFNIYKTKINININNYYLFKVPKKSFYLINPLASPCTGALHLNMDM